MPMNYDHWRYNVRCGRLLPPIKNILIYLRNNLPHRFLKENVFVTMHRMPFTIPADLCYALAPLHSRHQYWQLIANFIPHYPLSNIPYFPQPHPIFCHHIHKYLRQRYMPSAQVEPRFNNLAHARSAHLSRLMRLARQPLSLLMFLSPQRLCLLVFTTVTVLRSTAPPHYQLHQHYHALPLTKQYSNPSPIGLCLCQCLCLCCVLGLNLGLYPL